MEARARHMPGFRYFKIFTAEDGERVSLVGFDTLAERRDDAEHRLAQRRGREEFYNEYTIWVCLELAQRHFKRTGNLPL